MAIIVKKLVKNASFLYKMELIAGRNGMNNLVQWVHIIEDDAVSPFLHGYELVFTAGILNKTKDWLLEFAKKLNDSGVSAFVVNLGPHTKEIPKEVVEYCDEVNMPLFTIPWETRMVDMTRDFCRRIMMNDTVENSMASTIKNIIFNIGDLESQILQMERYGYKRSDRFCFISLYMEAKEQVSLEEYMDELNIHAEKTARRIRELFISFTYKENLVFVLVDYTDEEIESFCKDFLDYVKAKKKEYVIHMGVSSNQAGIYNQEQNFEKAISAMEMAKKQKEYVLYYDYLSVYKILYAVNDKTVLRSFYNDTIGLLEKYDRENQTDLLLLLKTYLENNASLQLVSEKMYIHRNTVTNQLKKIEKITGFNPLELEDKVKLYLGFYIQDII
ncbi:PucR family transcriptional regulator [Candidatus Galacturonibacter soehngenii]|uniref:PucR family transcriptional regulator n=1 Tax=Candidatus Galacturonatibacter soehngenii TaxID=2307010 RepID=A0A7V7UD13_9FIRM|nr:PucR family transcriptional regulator [Candidatus Galacturonibacter soehngenii]KAB1439836.1 PucR family transcriptional regulator [Candidatus Galacturonibacter soehngenii]MBA4685927.1 PucR family transcriptional regulator [Candidatus Galacturonibacter soehngenii]